MLLHCHWLPRTALETGCGETTELDSSAVPPIKRAATAATASRLRVDHGLNICGSPVVSPSLALRRDLFYERDHHLAAVGAISTFPSGACRNCDIDGFCVSGGLPQPANLPWTACGEFRRNFRSKTRTGIINLSGSLTFLESLGVIPEPDLELRKVGTARIMGGISARRAVHRCPVEDLGRSPTSNGETDFPTTTERATRPIQ